MKEDTMDDLASENAFLEVDLENGGTTSGEEANKDFVLDNQQGNNLLTRVWSGRMSRTSQESLDLLIDKSSGEENQGNVFLASKKCSKEKHKKTNFKKPGKPPRHPKGSSLDASDLKLIKEVSEIAMQRRVRIEQITALKKMRASKASSWYSNISAMLITLLFCLVVIFQGICCKSNSSMTFEGSPAPAAIKSDGLIGVEFYHSSPPAEGNGPSSHTLNAYNCGCQTVALHLVQRKEQVEILAEEERHGGCPSLAWLLGMGPSFTQISPKAYLFCIHMMCVHVCTLWLVC